MLMTPIIKTTITAFMLSVCTNALSQPLERTTVMTGLGGGPAFAGAGVSLSMPLTTEFDLLLAAGKGGALGSRFHPSTEYPRLGVSLLYGAVAETQKKDSRTGETKRTPVNGLSTLIGIAPDPDKLSFSIGIGYVIHRQDIDKDRFETSDASDFLINAGIHVPIRTRLATRIKKLLTFN